MLSNKSSHKYLNKKLKELDQVGKGYAHEKAQTTLDVVEERKRVCFGYLSYIQGAQVTEKKSKAMLLSLSDGDPLSDSTSCESSVNFSE